MPRVRRCRYDNCHKMCLLPHWYCDEHIEYEAAYLKSREKWNNKSSAYQKHYNHVVRNRDSGKASQYNFYRSRKWQVLRKRVLIRDHYQCRYCQVYGVMTTNSKTVDHIVPIEFNGTREADIDNLATICRKCHLKKTEWEQKYYGTGKNQKLRNVKEIQNIGMVTYLMNEK